MTKFYLLISIVLLNVASTFAQHENERKILGCWTLEKLEFATEMEGAQQISDGAKGTTICFDKNGIFTNGQAGSPGLKKGKYSISLDGKTLEQSVDGTDVMSVDVPGTILILDAKNLKLQAEEVILFFKRAD